MIILVLRRLAFIFLFAAFGTLGIVRAQFNSLQTNLIGWGSTNMNVEYGIKWSHHWTWHLPVQYNPFSLGNVRLRNFTVTPGARYWVRESYGRSFFIGGQAIATMYNVGGAFGSKYRYEGYGFGGGLSLGYSRPLTSRWNLEFEGGLGVLWTSYDKYICKTCGPKTDAGAGVRLIPSKLAVNIVYLF